MRIWSWLEEIIVIPSKERHKIISVGDIIIWDDPDSKEFGVVSIVDNIDQFFFLRCISDTKSLLVWLDEHNMSQNSDEWTDEQKILFQLTWG